MQPELIAVLIVSSIVLVWIVSSMGDRSDSSQDDNSGEEQDGNSSVGSGQEKNKPEYSDETDTSSTEIWSQDSNLDNQSPSATRGKTIKCPQCGERCDFRLSSVVIVVLD